MVRKMPPWPPPPQVVFPVLLSTPSQLGPPNSASPSPVGNGTSQSVTLTLAWLPYLQHMGSVPAAEIQIDHLQKGLSLVTHTHTHTHTHDHLQKGLSLDRSRAGIRGISFSLNSPGYLSLVTPVIFGKHDCFYQDALKIAEQMTRPLKALRNLLPL